MAAMIFNINGLNNLSPAERKKALDKARVAGGPSFASLLEQAGQVEEAAPAAATQSASLSSPLAGIVAEDEGDTPKNAKQQAASLLVGLQAAAEDILSGSPTLAAQKINRYLAAGVDDTELSPEQKQALEEIKTRAAVTAAKLEG